MMPTEESADLIALTRTIVDKELRPEVDEAERTAAFPREVFRTLGGAGYTRDLPVERYMRETKVMQIFEGTNQIQRLVINRDLGR